MHHSIQEQPTSSTRFRIVILACFSLILLLALHVSWQSSDDQSSGPESIFESEYIANSLLYEEDGTFSHDNIASPTKPALIAAARATQNVAWMEDLAAGYDLYPYNVDDRNAHTRLAIPLNKGHEAMVYLTYIINNYDALPPYAVFSHGHNESWHQQGDIIHLIQSLRKPALQQVGYVPLRCDWYPSCPAEINPITKDGVVWGPGVHRQEAEDAIADVWDMFFPGVETPHTIASQCCAQFAATREAIMRHPKERFVVMREWLLETELHDDISGRVLEKLWAYIMTGEPVHCPSPHSCSCNYFGQCEDQKWPKPPKALGKLPPDSNVL